MKSLSIACMLSWSEYIYLEEWCIWYGIRGQHFFGWVGNHLKWDGQRHQTLFEEPLVTRVAPSSSWSPSSIGATIFIFSHHWGPSYTYKWDPKSQVPSSTQVSKSQHGDKVLTFESQETIWFISIKVGSWLFYEKNLQVLFWNYGKRDTYCRMVLYVAMVFF